MLCLGGPHERYSTMSEQAVTSHDQLSVIEDWSLRMLDAIDREELSYDEIAQIEAVYALISAN